jgi:hypothetical protein
MHSTKKLLTMKSFLSFLLLAVAVVSTTAFGGYTPVFSNAPSVRSLMRFSFTIGQKRRTVEHDGMSVNGLIAIAHHSPCVSFVSSVPSTHHDAVSHRRLLYEDAEAWR